MMWLSDLGDSEFGRGQSKGRGREMMRVRNSTFENAYILKRPPSKQLQRKNGGASCSANSIMVQREKVKKQQKQKKSRSEKSGGKSRSVNEKGSKLSN